MSPRSFASGVERATPTPASSVGRVTRAATGERRPQPRSDFVRRRPGILSGRSGGLVRVAHGHKGPQGP